MSGVRPKSLRRLAAIGLAALLLTQACTTLSTDDGALLVSVAVSIAPAIGELADTYEADHPGTTVLRNTGASGVLLQQIRRGAPVDLFISASAAEMDRLDEDGLIDRGRVVALASNRLVLVTRAGMDADAGPRLRLDRYASIAVANPRTAPLGRYTRQALTALDAWEALSPRAILGENARQVIQYVARGEVDAGIVYLSDALMLRGRVERGPVLDAATHQPIAYLAVIPRDAPHREPAESFLRWLGSGDGTAVLARHGFPEAEE